MSKNLFGLTVAADKGLDDLQCQRLLSENRRYQEVMLQYRCALKALESRLEILMWGDRIFEKCGIRRDEEGDGGKTLEIRGKRRLSARDGGANYQQS